MAIQRRFQRSPNNVGYLNESPHTPATHDSTGNRKNKLKMHIVGKSFRPKPRLYLSQGSGGDHTLVFESKCAMNPSMVPPRGPDFHMSTQYIVHMDRHDNRSNQHLSKITTMPPPPRPLDGLVWPLVPNSRKQGGRSTTCANKQTLAEAIGAVGPALAERVLGERQWRQKYTKYVYEHVEACLQSKDAAMATSKTGL